MRNYKQVILLFVALLLISTTAYAAGSIDKEQTVGLDLSYQDGDMALSGAEFSLYLVAEIDAYGELTTTSTFQQFRVDIQGKNDEAWKTLASTLEGYVLRDDISPADSGKTGPDGCLLFPTGEKKLMQGLYLVLGKRHIQDGCRYDAAPFMVMLPTQDPADNEWVYNVTVEPKHESSKVPDSSDGPSTITRKVLKVWDDDNHEDARPEEITVQLLRNGKVYDTVTLSAENNWRHRWRDLDGDDQWNVVEEDTGDHTVQIRREGITFVVTNTFVSDGPSDPPTDGPTPPEETPPEPTLPTATQVPGEPALPKTGQLWWPVPLLICAGLICIVAGLLRRRGLGHEK